jgi:hypothetical protein
MTYVRGSGQSAARRVALASSLLAFGWAIVSRSAAPPPPPEPIREAPIDRDTGEKNPASVPGPAGAPAATAPIGTAGATPGAANTAPGGAPAPTVRQVTPTELQAGNSYALELSGTNLQPTMQIDFGFGILVQKALTVTDAGHAQVTVQVMAAAAAGRHPITVTYTPRATLAALPAVHTQGPGYIDVRAPAANGPVVLDRVSPSQVAQGQQATLTLLGSGFSAGMGVSFGPGITAGGPVVVQTPTLATLSIVVAAQAPAMQRHPTLLVATKDAKVSPEATLTVTASNVPGKPQPAPVAVATAGGNVPMLLAVSPARLFTGQSYTLTLRGVNLVPQLVVDLGPGITPKGGLRIQSPSLAALDVTVEPGAAAGMRWLGLRPPSALVAVREDASVLVQRSPAAGQGFAPVASVCHVALITQQGSIALDGPVYTGYTDEFGGHYNVPVLNDQTVFSWHEANPGLADRYELRFYSGATLIASRVLTASPGYALPHSLAADAALDRGIDQQGRRPCGPDRARKSAGGRRRAVVSLGRHLAGHRLENLLR